MSKPETSVCLGSFSWCVNSQPEIEIAKGYLLQIRNSMHKKYVHDNKNSWCVFEPHEFTIRCISNPSSTLDGRCRVIIKWSAIGRAFYIKRTFPLAKYAKKIHPNKRNVPKCKRGKSIFKNKSYQEDDNW